MLVSDVVCDNCTACLLDGASSIPRRQVGERRESAEHAS